MAGHTMLSGIQIKKKSSSTGRLSLFNHFIDMRTTVILSISCGKNMFLLENFNKNTFFIHDMDKLKGCSHVYIMIE